MSIVDKVANINTAIQGFVQTSLDTVEQFHQATVEVPVDLARDLGLEKAKADLIKDTHRRILTKLYRAVGSTNKLFGDLFVEQAGEVQGLVSSLTGGAKHTAEKPVPRKKTAATSKKKTAKKTAKKKAKKKVTSSRSSVRAKRSGTST